VQKIGWILAILCARVGSPARSGCPAMAKTLPFGKNRLRRTVDGWEKVNDWTFAIEKSPPACPRRFGLLIVTLSLAVGLVKNEPAK